MPVPSQGPDFVCLYTYEFWLSLCKIVRSSVILLLPLITYIANVCSLCQTHFDKLAHFRWIFSIWLSKFHAIFTSWTNLTRLGHRASSFCHIPNIWMEKCENLQNEKSPLDPFSQCLKRLILVFYYTMCNI